MPDEQPIDLRPDGTVWLVIREGTEQVPALTQRLRRPTIGELRDLHETLQAVNDHVVDSATSLPGFPDRPDRDAKAPAVAAYRKAQAAARETRKAFLADLDTRRLDWFRDAVKALGDIAALPESNRDLPAFAAAAEFANELLLHWQTVPLAVAAR